MATNPIARKLAAAPDAEMTMPALFIGHGNPMNAVEDIEAILKQISFETTLLSPRSIERGPIEASV